jgi:hypothetical protein
MIPVNFRRACKEIPVIEQAFRVRFGDEEGCNGGCDQDAAQIIQCPTFAFLTATWWLDRGSSVCPGKDLIVALDVCHDPNAAQGFGEISRCIFGLEERGGQRELYFNQSKAIAAKLLPQNVSRPFVGELVPLDIDLPPGSADGGGVAVCNVEIPCESGSQCCSQFGFCGTTAAHCGAGCLGGPCHVSAGAVVNNQTMVIVFFSFTGVFVFILVLTTIALCKLLYSPKQLLVQPLEFTEAEQEEE